MAAEQRGRTRRFLTLTLILCMSITAGVVGSRGVAAAGDAYQKLDIFSDVLSTIQNTYVEDAEVDDLVYGAIEGMLNTLDPHTSFLRPDAYQAMKVDTSGQFGGLGIEISYRDHVLTVVAPMEDTPASRAGIEAGDRILAIEGEYTEELGLMEAVKRMRGPRGTDVTITVMRDGWPSPKDLTLTREVIQVRSVSSEMLDHGIGYIRVAQFQERTTRDLDQALKELEEKDLQGLVLDFRNNPGGLLDQAIGISDLFLDEGLITYTEGRLPNTKQEFRASQGTDRTYPVVVLINGGSASASEIVAGALQEHKRAIVMGTPSFGKGSVQTIIPLRDGSALRLTTAKYYTPNGRSIQAKGIDPDIIVEQATIKETLASSMHRREADLERHLGGGVTIRPAGSDEDGEQDEESAEDEHRLHPSSDRADDYQLQRAVDLLRGYSMFSTLKKVVR